MTWTVGFKLELPLLHVLLHFIQREEKGMTFVSFLRTSGWATRSVF